MTQHQIQLFKATYASLRNRIHLSGYAPTSVTGSYPGMFPRDASIQVMAHTLCGDFAPALRILQYLFRYHRTYGYNYALHMILEDLPPFSDKIQTDTTFFLLHAWCVYMAAAPDSSEKAAFRAESTQQVYAFASYFFTDVYYSPEKKLLRNPSLEGPRMHSYFNAYDLLTNVYASQALHELSLLFRVEDAAQAAQWQERAELLRAGIHRNLTAEIDGRTVYMEMLAMDREDGATLQSTPHLKSYIGFTWVNLSPMGARWYGVDPGILQNTYACYQEYASNLYCNTYLLLEGESEYHLDGTCQHPPRKVLGKALAWELIYCQDTGKTNRIRQLLAFIDQNSETMYRETWYYHGGGSDAANQEHASWMVCAVRCILGSTAQVEI